MNIPFLTPEQAQSALRKHFKRCAEAPLIPEIKPILLTKVVDGCDGDCNCPIPCAGCKRNQ